MKTKRVLKPGEVFSELVVVIDTGSESVSVVCTCGAVKVVGRWELIQGKIKSCGHRIPTTCGHIGEKRSTTLSNTLCPDCSVKNTKLKKAYNITIQDYWKMLKQQGGVCAICKNPETEIIAGKLRSLAVDHDHSCCSGKRSCGNCIRGLLCSNCNKLLHRYADVTYFETLLNYVSRHK